MGACSRPGAGMRTTGETEASSGHAAVIATFASHYYYALAMYGVPTYGYSE